MWFTDLIQRWPSAQALASDILAQERTVSSWRQRDSIPAEWFAPVVRAAKARGFLEISLDLLAARAEARRLSSKSVAVAAQASAAP